MKSLVTVLQHFNNMLVECHDTILKQKEAAEHEAKCLMNNFSDDIDGRIDK